MYGAFIGDIVGSKYEFNNIKTKDFPLLSTGCDFTDDTIMTVAVGKAIMLSREEQFKKEKRSFRQLLIQTMQEFGRKYPYPTGAYGGNFTMWLLQTDPQPYESFGNGSAMRVSPCGLAAVTLEEAVALARVSAIVSHNHPEGIRGAEAVAAAVFMAKTGCSKEEIKEYIENHYYKLDFTLDSIRSSYRFDGSCQGSVPQAIVAFLESDDFEDAIRNVISIGGDCDTTGAITGSIAWTYYAVQGAQGYAGWATDHLDPKMLDIKKSILPYLPEEFIEIADQFHEVCWRRAGTLDRTGFCTPILSKEEEQEFHANWKSPFRPPVPETQACKTYTMNYLMEQAQTPSAHKPGSCVVYHDAVMRHWRMTIQLDTARVWFLSVFLKDDGTLDKFSLDEELASDSHYEFKAENEIRRSLYQKGDEDKFLHEILIAFVENQGGESLLSVLKPYITAQYHFD